jgi:DNA-binding transcriptional MerR regulator
MQPRELVKLYYRIGEVAEIVGVQPHVLRYWETEFRSIRPQKSTKGQRVYSRRDVEKLLRVKDLLRNQGFTIAGARKKLHDPADDARPERAAVQPERSSQSMRGALQAIRQDIIRMIAELDSRKNA